MCLIESNLINKKKEERKNCVRVVVLYKFECRPLGLFYLFFVVLVNSSFVFAQSCAILTKKENILKKYNKMDTYGQCA
jgi:hypothetical protein